MSDIVAKLREQIAPRTGDYMNDLLFTAAEEIERLRAERQWQPMETAPRDDNTEVLVTFKATGYVAMAVWRRHEESWLYFNDYKDEGELRSCDDADLCGWMPLPKPPEQKS